MTRKQIFILLADKGKSREEIRDMDIDWANEILFPERDEHGSPAFLSRLRAEQKARSQLQPKSTDPIDLYRYQLWLHGWPRHKIGTMLADLKKRRQALLKEAGIT